MITGKHNHEIKRNDTWDRKFGRFKGVDGNFRDMTGSTLQAQARRSVDDPNVWFELGVEWVDASLGIFRFKLTKEQTKNIDGPNKTDVSGVWDLQITFNREGETVRYTIMEGSVTVSKDVTRTEDEI
ncbi:hypothetical protein [Shewanella sp. MM_2022_3]|uniref:hypothetical protein n=1 Tax=Shewanella sp. MM_2022_3 TaxID=2923280 RepID=UPI001F4C42C7|nr:hypothetical protein [Shewanella sp. MM_2022_3]MCH7424983.1 hypothetical protein [Shewanella sp. MM_2022_3]